MINWVHVIDCHYLYPKFAAVFLIIREGSAILIENNTERAIPFIEKQLRTLNLELSRIEHLFVTHAHLDHAGATGRLSQLIPQATIWGHPKAINHLTNPEKLVQGVISVYGKQRFNDWYGSVLPVPLTQTRAVSNGEKFWWKGLEFEFTHTRGHANHHCIIRETQSQTLFTGDAFGLCYPELQGPRLFIFPTTSPTGYEPDPAIHAVHLIRKMNPKITYLTHFGGITQVKEATEQLLTDLAFSKSVVEDAAASRLNQADIPQYCTRRLTEHLKVRAEQIGIVWSNAQELLKLDLELNGAGMAVAASHLRKGAFSVNAS